MIQHHCTEKWRRNCAFLLLPAISSLPKNPSPPVASRFLQAAPTKAPYRRQAPAQSSPCPVPFSYGAQFTLITSYPAVAMTLLSSGSGISLSARMTVSFLVCELVTFFTGKALRTASLICASHIPHAIPSIPTVILTIKHPSFPSQVSKI